MFQKFEVRSVHTSVDPGLRQYVDKKIGKLDKYISRHDRQSAHAEVQLKEGKTKDRNNCTCEVTVHLPQQTINITESALNMYAAIDITEAKLKSQLQKHKQLHSSKRRQHLLNRFRTRTPLPVEAEIEV